RPAGRYLPAGSGCRSVRGRRTARSGRRDFRALLSRTRRGVPRRSRCGSGGARLLIAILLKGFADEGVDQGIVIEARHRIRIPELVIVPSANEKRAAPAERRAHMG